MGGSYAHIISSITLTDGCDSIYFSVVCVVCVTNPYCDGLVLYMYITIVSLLLHVCVSRCAFNRASKVYQPGKMEVFKMYDIAHQMHGHVVPHKS